MYDPMGLSPTRPRPAAGPPGFRLPWWILGLAGMAALLLALWIKPAPHQPLPPATSPAAAASAADVAPGPQRLSVIDLIGKVSLAVLLVYAAAFGVSRARRAGLLSQFIGAAPVAEGNSRLQLRESLLLGREEGTLYLIEVEGQKMLLGVAADQLHMLWTAAADHTSSFKPITDDRAEPRLGSTVVAPRPEEPLLQRGPGKVTRRESDWARERSRLIATLMQSE